MTEEDAKKKWCPFNISILIPLGMDKVAEGIKMEQDTNCIASDCMMWQEGNPTVIYGIAIEIIYNNGHCGLIGGKS